MNNVQGAGLGIRSGSRTLTTCETSKPFISKDFSNSLQSSSAVFSDVEPGNPHSPSPEKETHSKPVTHPHSPSSPTGTSGAAPDTPQYSEPIPPDLQRDPRHPLDHGEVQGFLGPVLRHGRDEDGSIRLKEVGAYDLISGIGPTIFQDVFCAEGLVASIACAVEEVHVSGVVQWLCSFGGPVAGRTGGI